MKRFQKGIHIFCIIVLICAASLYAQDIHDAVKSGDLATVRELVASDPAQLELRDRYGNTPLINACRNLQVDIANELLDRGANVNAVANGGVTPLLAFPYTPTLPIDLIRRLVDEGANVNAKLWLNRNWTVLVEFVRKGNTEAVEYLIDHGADINIRDIEGTPLQMTMNHNRLFSEDLSADHQLHENMAICLAEKGAELHEYSYGNMELHLAAMRGFANLVPVLLRRGADVNALNEDGRSPLFYAARHGHRKTVKALIAAGADKKAVVESNTGKAPQLKQTLNDGEAYLWNLNCELSPHTGFAIRTKNHVLIFDPGRVNRAKNAGLANGQLNPKELSGQAITVLTTLPMVKVDNMMHAFPDAGYVLCSQMGSGDGLPPYDVATAGETLSLNDITIHTISTSARLFGQKGLAYLVKTDDLTLFHAGIHFCYGDSSNLADFRKGIDDLTAFGPVDIAILPVKGRHLGSMAYEPYLYLIDQLKPSAIYLIGEELVAEEHQACREVLKARSVPVDYPDGGIAIGQRFFYTKNNR